MTQELHIPPFSRVTTEHLLWLVERELNAGAFWPSRNRRAQRELKTCLAHFDRLESLIFTHRPHETQAAYTVWNFGGVEVLVPVGTRKDLALAILHTAVTSPYHPIRLSDFDPAPLEAEDGEATTTPDRFSTMISRARALVAAEHRVLAEVLGRVKVSKDDATAVFEPRSTDPEVKTQEDDPAVKIL